MVAIEMNFGRISTCGCRLFMSFDADLPLSEQVHTYVPEGRVQALADAIRARKGQGPKPQPSPTICPSHSHLGHTVELFDAVMSEVTRKNIAGTLARDVKSDLVIRDDIRYSFDLDRVLLLQVRGLTSRQFAALQDSADLQFGPRKVVVLEGVW